MSDPKDSIIPFFIMAAFALIAFVSIVLFQFDKEAKEKIKRLDNRIRAMEEEIQEAASHYGIEFSWSKNGR